MAGKSLASEALAKVCLRNLLPGPHSEGVSMSFAIRISLFGFMSLTALAVSVQAADRDDVKRSIDAGVTALKGKQKANGFWIYGGGQNPSMNSIGATALAGLAL